MLCNIQKNPVDIRMNVRYSIYNRNTRSYLIEAIWMDINLMNYIGKTVEIIYQGNDGKLTQRRIEIRSIHSNRVRAFCQMQQGPRLFKIENILSAEPHPRSFL